MCFVTDCDPVSGHYTLTEADTFICMDSPNFIVNGYYGNFEIGDECTWVVDVSETCHHNIYVIFIWSIPTKGMHL